MLVLAEKPSVAKDFAAALQCIPKKGYYEGTNTIITYCIGHLYQLFSPEEYDPVYEKWTTEDLPIIPDPFRYTYNPKTKEQAEIVNALLMQHKNDTILIATDADREGELIGRICLMKAGITDLTYIKRFWVSQALTVSVVQEGIKNARNLNEYDKLFTQGLARQYADWLVGINFTRFFSVCSTQTLTVGRVQTAVINAIRLRNHEIENFRPEQYYEFLGTFTDPNGLKVTGNYFEYSQAGNLKPLKAFADINKGAALNSCLHKIANMVNQVKEVNTVNPQQLYNMAELQKEAFRKFDYDIKKTLQIAQTLYEKYKCLSYPRTNSRVMGTDNFDLVEKLFTVLSSVYEEKASQANVSNLIQTNNRIFNNSKLIAHHALLPLLPLPEDATNEERNIYGMVIQRFFHAFSDPFIYESILSYIKIEDKNFVIAGKNILQLGWKKYHFKNDEDEESQDVKDCNFNSLSCSKIETLKKFTKAKKYFTQETLLGFMENPRNTKDEENRKLVSLGTIATWSTIMDNLFTRDYIHLQKKNILMSEKGIFLLSQIDKNPLIKPISDIAKTTQWEESLEIDPKGFLEETKLFVKEALSVASSEIYSIPKEKITSCPLCRSGSMFEGEKNYYCSDYKKGCTFSLWKVIAGAKVSKADLKKLCEGKATGVKKCISKEKKTFSCSFILADGKVKFNIS